MYTLEEDDAKYGLFQIRRFDYTTTKGLQKTLRVMLRRMMFGWRVAISNENSNENKGYFNFEFDLCCGLDEFAINMTYNIVVGLLERRVDYLIAGRNLINLFPDFEVKPIYNDVLYLDFISQYVKYMSPTTVIFISASQLNELYEKYMAAKTV